MPKTAKVTVEVSEGPALRAALDVLDLTKELVKLIPPWHWVEIIELGERARWLGDVCLSGLRASDAERSTDT